MRVRELKNESSPLNNEHFFRMRAVVTGGAGFIGSHLAESLLADGWQVVVLDDLSNGFERNIPSGAEFVRGDASDIALLSRLLPGCDAVFHLAAVASVVDSIERPLEVHAVNLTTTLALLESASKAGVKRFVMSSSAAVYGDTHGALAREDMTPAPLSHYAVQKLASEYYCGVYHRLHGLETVCLRYFNVYGPRQRADSPYTGVITKFLTAARAAQPMIIFGDGGQSRDFVHVADVVAANIAAATRTSNLVAGKTFNIGTETSVPVRELAAMVRKLLPQTGEVRNEPPREGEILHSRADISRARQALGFDPRGRLENFLALGG